MRVYWPIIFRRAWLASCATLGLTSLGAVIIRIFLAVVVVSALLFWGSDGAAKDEVISRFVVAGLAIAALPLLFIAETVKAIPAYHAEAVSEVAALREQMIKKVSARTLSEEQKASLADTLRNSGCKPGSLNVLYDSTNTECADFAADIGDAVKMAGFRCTVHSGVMYPHNVRDRGLKIIRGKSKVLLSLADLIQAQFKDFGMNAERRDTESDETIFILVARRDDQ